MGFFAARRLHLNVKRCWPPSLICNCNQECLRRRVCVCVCMSSPKAPKRTWCVDASIDAQHRHRFWHRQCLAAPGGLRLLRSLASHLFVMHLCNLLWLSATCREKGRGKQEGAAEPVGLGAGSGRYIVWPRLQHARHLLNF